MEPLSMDSRIMLTRGQSTKKVNGCPKDYYEGNIWQLRSTQHHLIFLGSPLSFIPLLLVHD